MKKLLPITTTHFGDAVRAARKSAKLTIAGLASAVGYSTRAIISWETGDKRPPASAVVASIAAACEVEPEVLYLAVARDTGELRLPADVLALDREGCSDWLQQHLRDVRRVVDGALRAGLSGNRAEEVQ